MSLLPCITQANPNTALYGAAGGAGSFETASISSLAVSTLSGGYAAISDLDSAVCQTSLLYGSTLSGTSAQGTSTILFTVGDGAGGGGGTYVTNINMITSAVNSAPASAMFTVGLSGNGTVATVNSLANNSGATYNLSAISSNAYVNVWLANNSVGTSPPYVGTFTRIGF